MSGEGGTERAKPMTKAVQAAVLVEPKTIEVREFARPAIGADDALLRIG